MLSGGHLIAFEEYGGTMLPDRFVCCVQHLTYRFGRVVVRPRMVTAAFLSHPGTWEGRQGLLAAWAGGFMQPQSAAILQVMSI